MARAAPLVAIVNTSEEVAALLTAVVEAEGFRSTAAYVPDLKRRNPAPARFLAEHDPAAVFCDMAVPYVEKWAFYQQVQALPKSSGRGFILTCTNPAAPVRLVGPTPSHELVGRPFDLNEIVGAFRSALARREAERR